MDNTEFLCRDDLDYRDIQAIKGLKGDNSLNYDCCEKTKDELTTIIRESSYNNAVKTRLRNAGYFVYLELSCM